MMLLSCISRPCVSELNLLTKIKDYSRKRSRVGSCGECRRLCVRTSIFISCSFHFRFSLKMKDFYRTRSKVDFGGECCRGSIQIHTSACFPNLSTSMRPEVDVEENCQLETPTRVSHTSESKSDHSIECLPTCTSSHSLPPASILTSTNTTFPTPFPPQSNPYSHENSPRPAQPIFLARPTAPTAPPSQHTHRQNDSCSQ